MGMPAATEGAAETVMHSGEEKAASVVKADAEIGVNAVPANGELAAAV